MNSVDARQTSFRRVRLSLDQGGGGDKIKSGQHREPAVYGSTIMNARGKVRFWVAVMGIAWLLAVCGAAQDSQVLTPDADATKKIQTASSNLIQSANFEVSAPVQSQPSTTQPANAVQEILKMVDAGVSKDVIKTYIENTRFDLIPTAGDIITLKQHSVPDELTTALLKRSAQIQAQRAQTSPRLAVPADLGYGQLDPESYDYFQYYYLYPRTLAYTYERLGGYYAPGFPGYYFSLNQPCPAGYGYSRPFATPGAGFHLHR